MNLEFTKANLAEAKELNSDGSFKGIMKIITTENHVVSIRQTYKGKMFKKEILKQTPADLLNKLLPFLALTKPIDGKAAKAREFDDDWNVHVVDSSNEEHYFHELDFTDLDGLLTNSAQH